MAGGGKPIAVAVSGGVDSAMAAALLREAGLQVFGVTMRLPQWTGAASCEETIEAAARVCKHLNMSHHAVDLRSEFERDVVDPFCRAYSSGRTPNPCALCNRAIKFGALLQAAFSLGAGALATGHYARTENRAERWALLRGIDPAKDQSYFLSGLRQEQLAAVRFPLGLQTKDITRAQASARGLPAASRSESQEICFVADGAHAALVEERMGPSRPGPILTLDGREIGRHRGLPHYTIGQRRGLGIAAPEPYYVAALDPVRNAVVAAHAADAQAQTIHTGPANWVSRAPSEKPLRMAVQVRYRQAPVPCLALPQAGGKLTLVLEAPMRGVAPGQWAVCYEGDAVALSAVIDRTEAAGEG